MKYRTGFVSNSSSSSFAVIAEPGQTKFKICLEIDLADYASHIMDSPEQVEKYLVSSYGSHGMSDPQCIKEREEILDTLAKGKIFLVGSFSDDRYNAVENMLCNEGLLAFKDDNPHIEIVYGSGGY
jgi:hypothetical protein